MFTLGYFRGGARQIDFTEEHCGSVESQFPLKTLKDALPR
jgi:hypothetical protein